MRETISPAPSVSELEPGETVSYRAVSRWAVFALLFGAASALALAHPLLWIVPPTAVVLAIFALRDIAARPTEVVGRGAALSGLVLALMFGTLAPARLVSRQARIYAQARLYADAWLKTVQSGKLYEAYELHLPAKDRHASEADLREIYGELAQVSDPNSVMPMPDMLRPDPRTSIRVFFSEPAVKTLVVTGRSGELVFVGNESQTHRVESSSDDAVLRYELRFEERGQPRKTMLEMMLTRTYDAGTRRATWHVASLRKPN